MAYLPQDPQILFLKDSIYEELKDAKETRLGELCQNQEGDSVKEEYEVWEKEIYAMTGVEKLFDRHPYDLSGGEQQCAALAKLLLAQPSLLLLDEPTKGMDGMGKKRLGEMLWHGKQRGITILIATHDLEFAADYADRCGLLFQGKIVAENVPSEFFAGNRFYTTTANRIAGECFPEIITVKDVVEVLQEAWQG